VDTYGRVIDALDAMTLVTLDAMMQARGGPPPERPGMTVSSA